MGKTVKPKLGIEIPEELKQALLAAASENRISCKAAQHIADEGGWDYAFVGKAIDEIGLKVRGCQLGCF